MKKFSLLFALVLVLYISTPCFCSTDDDKIRRNNFNECVKSGENRSVCYKLYWIKK